jgi:hypothetical protein
MPLSKWCQEAPAQQPPDISASMFPLSGERRPIASERIASGRLTSRYTSQVMLLRLFGGAVVIAAVLVARTVDVPADLWHLFAYDSTAPLDVQQRMVETDGDAQVVDVTFPSPKGGRVPAYLATPPAGVGHAKRAGIVFGHWGPGNRSEFLAESKHYAKAGVVSVLIDYPWTRPAQWRHPVMTPKTTSEEDRDTYIQAVVDLRRPFDLLRAA